KITLAICKETLNELKIKLSSPEIKKLLQYKPYLNAIFTAWYQYNAKMYYLQPTDVHFNVRDPNDIIYLQLALISKADYLISGDKDLLILQSVGKTCIIKPNIFINKFMVE
ncbi:MAG: putative toxin-antitoxin system toxin component, PIN family, partial [bacterium]|nr:putative toxin-antitoxin system toxin component, PIN family [bacterium]